MIAANLLHMLVILPLLAYVGHMLVKREPIDDRVAYVLLGVAILAIPFHAYKVFQFVRMNGVRALFSRQSFA